MKWLTWKTARRSILFAHRPDGDGHCGRRAVVAMVHELLRFHFLLVPHPDGGSMGHFYLFVHYRPCPYLEGKRQILNELVSEEKPAGKLPVDVPFDVVLALNHFPFYQLFTIEELKEEALNGNYEWFIHLLGYLDCPLVKREIGDLEQVFADFADCRHEKIRREVTALAHLHGWRNLLNQLQEND